MSVFNDEERVYLSGQRLGRLATADSRGRPHVVPTGFRFDAEEGVLRVGGHNLTRSKKFRDVLANPHAAFVVDDLVSTNPWRVRGIEIRGEAQALTEGGEALSPGFGSAWIEIKPDSISSWGLGNRP